MDKSVILAVAGSGKTSTLIDRLNDTERFLLITYTDNNHAHLRWRVMSKFGCMPKNITVMTYFTFLYSFCYQPFLADVMGAKGINWDSPPLWPRYGSNDLRYYMDKSKRLYSNRIAKLFQNTMPDICARLEKYFDHLFIDEVQDFGGHDLNLLCSLGGTNIDIMLVGDFYQHTFDTSRDGNVNGSIYDTEAKYTGKLQQAGFMIDTVSHGKSYRCSPTVCEFVSDRLGIDIKSHRTDQTVVEFVEDNDAVARIFSDPSIVKLFYKEHYRYPCLSENWGKSKGQDHYNEVCVVLNTRTLTAYKNDDLATIAPSSRNKLYVACTRARGNLYFIPEPKIKDRKKPK